MQVTVTVTDDHGKFVAGLPRSAFHVFEDGKPQTLSYFASEDVPLELDRRGRHQRQHDAGDAEAEARGEGFSRRGARRATR